MSCAATRKPTYSVNLDSTLRKVYLNDIFATDDCCANGVNLPMFKGTAPAEFGSGAAVKGYFIRYRDNVTVLLDGELNGNVASVELKKACYTQSGQFALVVKIYEGDVISTIFYGEGSVIAANTGSYVDPDDIIPSLDDLLAQIAAMEAATADAKDATAAARILLTDESAAQVTAIRNEGAAQVAAVNAASAEQQEAIEQKGANTLATIPEDYTVLTEDVSTLKDTKAPVIEVEASGSIITVDDAAAMNVRGLVSTIKPVQAAGTPSPDNPLPISGWDAVNAQRTGENLFGGEFMRDVIVEKASGVYDELTNTVRAAAYYLGSKCLFSNFKENTQYTFVITGYNEDANRGNGNIRIRYTDGTTQDINFGSNDTTKSTSVTVSFAGKSIDGLYGVFQAAYSVFYLNECGVFEGVLTADDFVPYEGQTLTAALPETVYGGTLDWKTGVLTVTHIRRVMTGNEVMSANPTVGAGAGRFRFYYSPGDVKQQYPTTSIAKELYCSHYQAASEDGVYRGTQGVSASQAIYFGDNRFDTVEEFKTYLAGQNTAGTPVTLVYMLKNPYTIQLTPQQLETLKGLNNVWSDTGDTSLVYVADTKMYIDKRISELVTLALANS